MRSVMRILHTMLRVGNLENSINFYTNVLGMKVLRKETYPEGKFDLAFVGYGNEIDNSVIELTYNWGVDSYELGSGFGHIAIAVENASITCDIARNKGANVIREAGPMKHGSIIIAFLSDPDGYKIELIERQ